MLKPSATQSNGASLSGGLAGLRALNNVHRARTVPELHQVLDRHLERLLPETPAAIVLHEEGAYRVELRHGRCSWYVGEILDEPHWDGACVQIPLRYGDDEVGVFVLGVHDLASVGEEIIALADQAAIALVNLHLQSDVLRTTEHYCASLQAFEEGFVLFKERDADVAGARFLELMVSMLGTQAGALLLLDRTSDLDSPLRIQHLHGVPESTIDELYSRSHQWWPAMAVRRAAGVQRRSADGSRFDDLDASIAPAVMESVVHVPLRYHGVQIGLALVFNVADHDAFRLDLERARRLGELGAALFHRISLEQTALDAQTAEARQELATDIHTRLVPRATPELDGIDIGWNSLTAHHDAGDYIDLLVAADNSMHATLADVSGHSVESALLVHTFRAAYRAYFDRAQIEDVAAFLNQETYGESQATGMFIGATLLSVSPDRSRLRAVIAGHTTLLWYRSETDKIELIAPTSPSLGLFEESSFASARCEPTAGDVVLLYSDGAVDATDSRRERFGQTRLQQALRQVARHGQSARDCAKSIVAAIDEFTEGEKVEDDVSVIVLRWV